MDYEKAYKEALERAKAGKPLDEVFSELKESKDERIRKVLLRCCDDWEKGQFGCMAKEDVPAIRAYLEKQKEQNSGDKDRYMEGYMNGMNDALKEQKPAEWSEEWEKRIVELKTFITQCNGFNKANRQKAFELIDALRPHWKPSKEQMKALNAVANEGVLLDLFNDLLKLL